VKICPNSDNFDTDKTGLQQIHERDYFNRKKEKRGHYHHDEMAGVRDIHIWGIWK
jgi:hypothetical protein